MGQRILVVDDEPDLLELVRVNLSQAGFEVDTAETGRQALERARRSAPDLLILDLMLPDLSGTEVCRHLRADPALGEVPIIMLTARADEVDRVVGLEIGGDDYDTKPFSPRELVARVRALLRRGAGGESAGAPAEPASPELRHGDLALDPDRHRAKWKGAPLELTVTEFALLRALLARPGRVYTRSELVDRAFGEGHFIEDRTIDTHVKRLRKKLSAVGADPVETVYGVGYRLRD